MSLHKQIASDQRFQILTFTRCPQTRLNYVTEWLRVCHNPVLEDLVDSVLCNDTGTLLIPDCSTKVQTIPVNVNEISSTINVWQMAE
jgi:hypothetical protein